MEELIKEVRGNPNKVRFLIATDKVTIIRGTLTGFSVEVMSKIEYLKQQGLK